MFPVKCKDLLPLDHLVIKSVSIRGDLGPVTVWVNKEDAADSRRVNDHSVQRRVRLNPKYWTKLYDQSLKPSRRTYQKLELTSPIKLKPGEIKVLYIHSTLHDDSAIVYDNTPYGRSSNQFEDDKLAIMTGRAHVSTETFGQNPIWGYGNAWRDRREFVGRLEYGTVFKLWNPQVQPKFGGKFQEGARALFLCQRRWESPWSIFPDEVIFYILNMCRWDWFDDTSSTMKERRRREKTRKHEAIEAAKRQEEETKVAAVATTAVASVPITTTTTTTTTETEEEEDSKPAACTACCGRTDSNSDNDGNREDDDQSMEDADEDDNEGDDNEDWQSADEEDEDDDDDDSDAWSEEEEEVLDPYHRANTNAFEFQDIDSDQDTDDEREAQAERLQNWRSHFARIHVLRALASMEDTAVADDYF